MGTSIDIIIYVVMGIAIGFILTTLIVAVIYWDTVTLNQEAADDVCEQLTGNESAIAVDNIDFKLHCELPGYGSTQNIIIRGNDKE